SINGTDNGYRSDGVDLEVTSDTGGGVDLGWTFGGDWFKYTVKVATAGTYTVSFRVAAPTAVTDAFHLANSSGTNLSGSVNVPATGGYQTWTTVTANVTLPAGQQVLTLDQDNGGWNINYLGFATASSAPNFGPNVIIFDPSMSASSIQSQINSIYSQQQTNQFGSARYALLFKPGSYSNTVNVGYYTQVLGLGQSPDNVTINGGVISNAVLSNNNATQNFWEGAENLSVVPSGGTDQWAVSQACPMRRVHIKGSIVLDQNGGYSSGGFLSDSLIDSQINSGSQQQWISRNSKWGSWAGSNWNMVFVGDTNAPSGANWPNPAYSVTNNTPVSREKPFLTIDGSGNYSVFVPALSTNSQGITWSSGSSPGQSIPISQFYIAQASSDTAATLNAALSQGKNLLLTPGVYSLNATLQVNNPNTVVLGLGLATLLSQNGVTAMNVADVDGVIIAGILFDAGPTNSSCQLQVGPSGSSANHSANPICLDDIFCRVGGAAVGKTTVSVQINSSNVVGDDFWIWRADHGNGGTVGWTTNTATNGLVVNGANVTIYGLAVEHYQQYQTLWNGNGGSVYFYQSEAPYDPPNQSSWMAGSEDGYASYKVANTVTSHQAYGVGIYCFFDVNSSVILGNAIEVPTSGLNGGMFHDMTTVSLGGVGTIAHVIDGYGATANSSNSVVRLSQ
ncbi:MAG TPA: carbohydrate-binding protein, partial [Opitutaceae bacterium]|nr:carbohydrate-binding protein [Opitutaceae bacterium]